MKNKITLAVSLALLPCLASAGGAGLDKRKLLGAPMQVKASSYAPELSNAKSYSKNISFKAQSNSDYFIVELEDAPLATYQGGVAGYAATSVAAADGGAFNVKSTEATSYNNYLVGKQKSFAAQLSRKVAGAKVIKTFSTLYNGVVVYGDKTQMDLLKGLSGVKAVHPQRMFYATMDRSLELINADKAWQAFSAKADAGKGVKVAIVDSGIRPEHPMFAGDNFTAMTDLPESFATDYCRTVDESFCNNKLIVARYSEPTFEVHESEYMSPLGYSGHGTHVAGTAVGNEVNINYQGTDVTVSGVAPGAYLMAYKGLFAGPDGRGSGSNVMLMEALEHAVNDGADVINNSWGGGAGMDPALSPYAATLAAAEAAGVVVINSAGNEGNGAQTIGCPSCVDSGLSIANTTTGRFFANTVAVAGEEFMALDSSEPALSEDVMMPVVAAAMVEAENFEGCEPYTDETAFADSIALVSRGTCAFTQKAANAAAAGAKALVIYNNRPAQPIYMSIETDLPALMISQASGIAILESLESGAMEMTLGAQIKRIIDEQYADNVAGTSSRGPNGDANILKPDMAAPGTDILSAASPDTNGGSMYMAISGTSMAAPHVTGAAALVKAIHPDWSATQIQTALTSTTVQGMLDDDATSLADAFDVGSGRLDVEQAINAMVTFNKPSMASAACIGACSFSRSITNMTDMSGEWSAAISFSDANVSATVMPATVSLDAFASDGESSDFMVSVDTSYAAADSWVMGQLTWTHSSGAKAVMPLALYANDSTDSTVLSNATTDEMPENGAPVNLRTAIANKTFTDEITVEVDLKGASLVAGSESAVVNKGTQTFLGVDQTTGKLTWKGMLDTSELNVVKSTIFGGDTDNFWDLHEIAGFGIPVTTYACEGACDEFSFEIEYNYSFMGRDYGVVTVSDNGLITAGSQDTRGTWFNQNLPSSTAPNNVLAPYWTDFDLLGGDTGAGSIMYAQFNVGVNVLVIQWDKVAVWGGDPTQTYTFQVWIMEGTDTIWFTYGDLADTPAALTIGAENIAGDTGTNYYYNGTGNADFSAFDTLEVVALVGGTVDFDYQAVTDNKDKYASADMVDAVEEMPLSIDVLANDMGKGSFVTMSSMTATDGMHKAAKVIEVNANGGLDASSIIVTKAPAGGSATLVDGMIHYVPKKDFFGKDSFSYTVADANGTVSDETMVTVMVANVNDAPVLTARKDVAIVAGKSTMLSVPNNDADGDALTFTWAQITGPHVDFTNGGPSIAFTAPPESEVGNILTFQVTAHDGQVSSEPVTITAKVTSQGSSSSGSLGFITLLLLPVALLRRRKV